MRSKAAAARGRNATTKGTAKGTTLLALADPLSARMFFHGGVVGELQKALGEELRLLSTLHEFDFGRWLGDDGRRSLYSEQDLRAEGLSPLQRLGASVDAFLDRQIGFFPLAIRFNYRHGLHAERMTRGHKNYFLDSARVGVLPRSELSYRLMFRWLYSRWRFIPPWVDTVMGGVSAFATSNLQHPSMPPYLAAARRAGVPVVGHIASWDHPCGKGVVYPWCESYVVQNGIMKRDLVEYHGIDAGRIVVTGWPQTDVFAVRRTRAEFESLLGSYGLDPGRKCVLMTGNTETNAPYEPRFVERLLDWREARPGGKALNLIFRPHPKDSNWRARYGAAMGRDGVHVQEPSYSDIGDVLSVLLQHADCVVTNAGTILLDSLVNDRPAVCVTYDEGAPPGESYAFKNVIGRHYEELMSSGAFVVAENFAQVASGVERCLEIPGELAAQRREVCRLVVGEVDGGAGARVAGAILAGVRGGRSAGGRGR